MHNPPENGQGDSAPAGFFLQDDGAVFLQSPTSRPMLLWVSDLPDEQRQHLPARTGPLSEPQTQRIIEPLRKQGLFPDVAHTPCDCEKSNINNSAETVIHSCLIEFTNGSMEWIPPLARLITKRGNPQQKQPTSPRFIEKPGVVFRAWSDWPHASRVFGCLSSDVLPSLDEERPLSCAVAGSLACLSESDMEQADERRIRLVYDPFQLLNPFSGTSSPAPASTEPEGFTACQQAIEEGFLPHVVWPLSRGWPANGAMQAMLENASLVGRLTVVDDAPRSPVGPACQSSACQPLLDLYEANRVDFSQTAPFQALLSNLFNGRSRRIPLAIRCGIDAEGQATLGMAGLKVPVLGTDPVDWDRALDSLFESANQRVTEYLQLEQSRCAQCPWRYLCDRDQILEVDHPALLRFPLAACFDRFCALRQTWIPEVVKSLVRHFSDERGQPTEPHYQQARYRDGRITFQRKPVPAETAPSEAPTA